MVTTQHTDRIFDAMANCRLKLDVGAAANLDDTLDIDFHEHSAYHIAKSIAQANGTISTDEAWTVAMNLGNVWAPDNGGWARRADTAAKIVITKLIGRILGADPHAAPADALPSS